MEISHFSAFSMANFARFAAYVSQAPTLISLQGPTVPSLTRRVARSAARRESNWIAKSKSSLIAGHALSPGPLPRLHDNRRADGRRRMVDFTSIIEGARRWFYSAGQKRIQDRSSRPSAGEP